MTSDYTEQEIMESMSETDGYDWALKTILRLQKDRSDARRSIQSLKRQLNGAVGLMVQHGVDLEKLNESK
jgi:hypothetical protein